jgi:ATP-dependent exoDNAse (exonuclease V) beta subunit
MIQKPEKENDYYYIPELKEWFPRVTQVLKIISKGEAFENWLRNKGQESKTLLSDAGDIGTSLHNRLEEIGKGIKINKDALKERERLWVEEFEVWQNENVSRFIETERTVFNAVDGYAGTLDSLVELKDKRIALLDYKTTKYIYDTHELQVVAYLRAYEQMFKIKIDTAFILNFSKENKTKFLTIKEVKDISGQYEIWLHALKLWYWKFGKYQESKTNV